MPNNAKNYDVTKIYQGPADLWIIGGTVPDTVPPLTLTNGIPDNTAHPNSVHLGFSDGGTTFEAKPKMEGVTAEQAESPVMYYLSSLELMLTSAIKQVDPALLQYAAPFGTYSTSSAPSAYSAISFGGNSSFAPICIAMIAPTPQDATKFVVGVIFKAVGNIGISTDFSRAKAASCKLSFVNQQDLTRTAGRQSGIFYRTTAT